MVYLVCDFIDFLCVDMWHDVGKPLKITGKHFKQKYKCGLCVGYRGFSFKSSFRLKATFVPLWMSYRMSTMMVQSPKLLNEKTHLRAPKKRAFKRETPVILSAKPHIIYNKYSDLHGATTTSIHAYNQTKHTINQCTTTNTTPSNPNSQYYPIR